MPFRRFAKFGFRRPFSRDNRGAATVEFVLLFPVIAGLLAIVVFGGEGFEIDRKLTMTTRTLADLATQQTSVGASSTTYTYTQILNAASLVMTPYASSQLQMTLSEIQTTGTGSGTVIWSTATTGATPLTSGSTVTVPSNLTATTGAYLILGQATYNYQPLQLYFSISPITLSSSLYLSPRVSTKIACCT